MLAVIGGKRAAGNDVIPPPVTPPVVTDPTPPPFEQGGYDGWAQLPLVVPTYLYEPPAGGQTHTPTTAAQLRTLLTGGNIGTGVLARGDIIVLQAGTTYANGGTPFTFPALPGSGWVYVISSAAASLPAFGRRVALSDVQYMPTIQTTANNVFAIEFADNASHWFLSGINFQRPATTAVSSSFVHLGNASTTLAAIPSYLTLDRCVIDTGTSYGVSRCVTLAGANTVIGGCYIRNWAMEGSEQQAVGGWNCPGPLLVENNTLIASTENFMLGGSDPVIAGMNPQDVTFRRNYVTKDYASWWPTKLGSIKNLFELKKGIRVLVEDNLFEYFWGDGQNMAVNLKSANQGGPDTTAETRDVVVRWNRFKNVATGVSMATDTTGPTKPSVPASRITIKNNLFTEIASSLLAPGAGAYDYTHKFLGTDFVLFEHNTSLITQSVGSTGQGCLALDSTSGGQGNPTIVRANVWDRRGFGVKLSGGGEGQTGFAAYTTDPLSIMEKNVTIGGSAALYPNDYTPATQTAAGIDPATYGLTTSSPYKGVVSGADPGADVTTLAQRTAGCLTGVWG